MEAFNQLLSTERDNTWREQTNFRQANKRWLKKSAKVAIKVNRALRAQGMSQKNLAEKIGVSAQQVSKVLKGRENLTLETIGKLELALGLELISILREDEIIVKKNLESVAAIARQILTKTYPKEAVTQSEKPAYNKQSILQHFRQELRTYATVTVNTNTKQLEENTAVAA